MRDFEIIAVDFDGTLCEDMYPFIGSPNFQLIDKLKQMQKAGDKLILWTCRVGKLLDDAVRWCKEEHGLIFDAVNENLPELTAMYGGDTRKIFADKYMDDRSYCAEFKLPFKAERT